MGAPVFLTGSLANLPTTRDSDTLYFCTDGKLYKGNNLIAEKNNTVSVVPMIVGSATGHTTDNGLTFEIVAKQGISNMNNIPAGTVFMIHNTVDNCSNLSYLEDDESGNDFYFINPVTVSMNGGIIAYSYIGGDGDLFVFSAT